jgi:hypothetical protein
MERAQSLGSIAGLVSRTSRPAHRSRRPSTAARAPPTEKDVARYYYLALRCLGPLLDIFTHPVDPTCGGCCGTLRFPFRDFSLPLPGRGKMYDCLRTPVKGERPNKAREGKESHEPNTTDTHLNTTDTHLNTTDTHLNTTGTHLNTTAGAVQPRLAAHPLAMQRQHHRTFGATRTAARAVARAVACAVSAAATTAHRPLAR